jgi:hypothetical protein
MSVFRNDVLMNWQITHDISSGDLVTAFIDNDLRWKKTALVKVSTTGVEQALQIPLTSRGFPEQSLTSSSDWFTSKAMEPIVKAEYCIKRRGQMYVAIQHCKLTEQHSGVCGVESPIIPCCPGSQPCGHR